MIDENIQDIQHRLYSKGDQTRYPFFVGLFGNLALAVVKVSFGVFGGSKLVLLDGLFSFMAATAFLLPWQAAVLAKKQPEERYPYGVGKVLFISTTVVGFLGLLIAIHMFVYSIRVMSWGVMYGSRGGAIMVTIMSIVGNEILYRYLSGKSKSHLAIVAGLSTRYNHIGIWISCLVLLLQILAGLGATYLERAGVAVISIIVFVVALRMIVIGFGGIMDKNPPKKIMQQIRLCVQKINKVKDIINVKARYVGTFLHIDMSIAVDNDTNMQDVDEIIRNVKQQLKTMIPMAEEVNVIIA